MTALTIAGAVCLKQCIETLYRFFHYRPTPGFYEGWRVLQRPLGTGITGALLLLLITATGVTGQAQSLSDPVPGASYVWPPPTEDGYWNDPELSPNQAQPVPPSYEVPHAAPEAQGTQGAQRAPTTRNSPHARQGKPAKKPSFLGKLFGQKPKGPPPVPEEKITQIGPRKFNPQPDPLVRLSSPVLVQERVLAPGFYLAQVIRESGQTPGQERAMGNPRQLQLRSGRVIMARLNLRPVPNSSAYAQSAQSPLDVADPKQDSVLTTVQVSLIHSPDQRYMALVVWDGFTRQAYMSETMAIHNDPRPVLP